MCAAVDFVVAGRTCNGGNQVWRFGTGAAQSSQPDMCQYRRFRVAITYAVILPGIPDYALLFSNQP